MAILAVGGLLLARKGDKRFHWAAGLSLAVGIFHPVAIVFVAHALWLTTRHVGFFGEACAIFLPFGLGALGLGVYSWRAIRKEPNRYTGKAAAILGTAIGAVWTVGGLGVPLGLLLWRFGGHGVGP